MGTFGFSTHVLIFSANGSDYFSHFLQWQSVHRVLEQWKNLPRLRLATSMVLSLETQLHYPSTIRTPEHPNDTSPQGNLQFLHFSEYNAPPFYRTLFWWSCRLISTFVTTLLRTMSLLIRCSRLSELFPRNEKGGNGYNKASNGDARLCSRS